MYNENIYELNEIAERLEALCEETEIFMDAMRDKAYFNAVGAFADRLQELHLDLCELLENMPKVPELQWEGDSDAAVN